MTTLAEELADLLDEQTNWQYENPYLLAMADEILVLVTSREDINP